MRIFLILMLLLPALCFAGIQPHYFKIAKSRVASGGGGCANTLYDSTSETPTADVDVYDSTNMKYNGQLYNEASAHTICSVSVVLSWKAGDVTDRNFYVEIYDKSGANLGTLLGQSDAVVGSNAWSVSTVEFAFSTPVALSDSTNFAIVLTVAHAVDSGNYVEFEYAGELINGKRATWADDKSFVTDASTQDMLIKVMYQ
jgi:hypothetical protein